MDLFLAADDSDSDETTIEEAPVVAVVGEENDDEELLPPVSASVSFFEEQGALGEFLGAAPPIFLSDAIGMQEGLSLGGGRGYVAKRDLKAGELLIVDRPIIARGENIDDFADDEKLKNLLGYPDRSKIWQWNAFESGLFVSLSLFNDSPEPNCVQLRVKDDDRNEVWTFRSVPKDEALTLSYVSPFIDATPAQRSTYLRTHHGVEESTEEPEDVDIVMDELQATIDSVDVFEEFPSDFVDLTLSGKQQRRAFGLAARMAEISKTVDTETVLGIFKDDNIPRDLQPSAVALWAALEWRSLLVADPVVGDAHPDSGLAAGIAANALAKLIPRCPRPLLADIAHRPSWHRPADVFTAFRSLQAHADDILRLYDSRRWLSTTT